MNRNINEDTINDNDNNETTITGGAHYNKEDILNLRYLYAACKVICSKVNSIINIIINRILPEITKEIVNNKNNDKNN